MDEKPVPRAQRAFWRFEVFPGWLESWLEKWLKHFAGLTLAFALLMSFAPLAAGPLRTSATPGGIVSFEFAWTPGIARTMMEVWGPEGRAAAWISLVLDLPFLIFYGLLLAGLCLWAARKIAARSPFAAQLGRLLAWGQLLAAGFDLVEDACLAFMLFRFPRVVQPSWPAIAAVCATCKFWLIGFGVAYVFLVAIKQPEARELLRIARAMRYSLILSLVAPLFLIGINQMQEVLRVLAEDLPTPGGVVRVLLFFAATLWLAVVSWGWARAIGFLVSDQAPYTRARHAGLVWLPLASLVLPLLLTAWALYLAAQPIAPRAVDSPTAAALSSQGAATGTAAGGGVLLSLVRSPEYHLLLWLTGGMGLLAVVCFLMLWAGRNKIRPTPGSSTFGSRWSQLGSRTKCLLVVSFLPGLGVFALVGFGGPGGSLAARSIGPAAVLMLGLGFTIPLGSLLVIGAEWTRLPLTGAAFCAALLFAALDLNDNHAVRLSGARYPVPELNDSFRSWLSQRPDQHEYSDTAPYPVFFVAAEGGGIRAGYQTVMVLSALQDANPAFASHTFCISGVSGGSLGAGVYGALTALSDAGQMKPASWRDTTDAIFSRDMLSPVVAAFVSPELVQRFLWWPDMRFDRARALEYSFEAAWREGTGDTNDRFAAPLYALRNPAETGNVPALFLNTTRVEEGDRMAVSTHQVLSPTLTPTLGSPLLDRARTDPSGLPTLVDIHPDASLPLSTAVALGARFPYITPSGYLTVEPGTSAAAPIPSRIKLRYVDGGYFDNSGLMTLEDLVTALEADPCLQAVSWYPVIIRISFGGRADLDQRLDERARRLRRRTPGSLTAEQARDLVKRQDPELQRLRRVAARIKSGTSPAPVLRSGPGFEELLTPLRAFFATWNGGVRTESRRFKTRLEERQQQLTAPGPANRRSSGKASRPGELVEFAFFEYDQPLPLGWLLSRRSRQELQDQLGPLPGGTPPDGVAAYIESTRLQEDASANERSLAAVLDALAARESTHSLPHIR